MLRGNSKLGGNAGHGILTCRVFSENSTQNLSFDAKNITTELEYFQLQYIQKTVWVFRYQDVVIVENLDVFMAIKYIIPNIDVAIYSGGLDSRVIEWLNDCIQICTVIHAGDYDAVGLKEFIRYEREISHEVEFYVHDSITVDDFKRYGRSELVGKGRNLSMIDSVRKHETTDDGFNKCLNFVLNSGNGLEQEFLLSLLEQN